MNKKLTAITLGGALAVALGAGAFAATSASAHHVSSGSRLAPTQPVTAAPTQLAPAAAHSRSTAPIVASPGSDTVTSADVWNIVSGMYDHTLASNPHYLPTPGSFPAQIATAGGSIAQYVSPDGNSVVIAVADGNFARQEAAVAANSTRIAGYGTNGEVQVYEMDSGGTYSGDFEVFDHGYWFSLTSNLFSSPQAAAPVIGSALQSIPVG